MLSLNYYLICLVLEWISTDLYEGLDNSKKKLYISLLSFF